MTAFFCKKIALYVFQYAFLLAAVPVLPIPKRLVFHKPQLWFIHFTVVVYLFHSRGFMNKRLFVGPYIGKKWKNRHCRKNLCHFVREKFYFCTNYKKLKNEKSGTYPLRVSRQYLPFVGRRGNYARA